MKVIPSVCSQLTVAVTHKDILNRISLYDGWKLKIKKGYGNFMHLFTSQMMFSAWKAVGFVFWCQVLRKGALRSHNVTVWDSTKAKMFHCFILRHIFSQPWLMICCSPITVTGRRSLDLNFEKKSTEEMVSMSLCTSKWHLRTTSQTLKIKPIALKFWLVTFKTYMNKLRLTKDRYLFIE